jgi:hypothetical protein
MFIVFLRDQKWLEIREALRNGDDIVVPLQGDNGLQPATLEIEFLQSTYHYPPASVELRFPEGVVKRWQSQQPGWLENSALRLDAIAVGDTFGPDPTANPTVVNLMHQIGQVISAIIPEKKPTSPAKLLIVEFGLPAKSAEECFNLRASPDLEGIDAMKIWDAFENLQLPQIAEDASVVMFFAVWE